MKLMAKNKSSHNSKDEHRFTSSTVTNQKSSEGLKHNFNFVLRLQVGSVKILDLSHDKNYNSRSKKDMNKLIVKKKPTYIEDDPVIVTLMKNKFLEMQKFELNKMLLEREAM